MDELHYINFVIWKNQRLQKFGMVIALVSQSLSYPVTDASDAIGTDKCGTALFILDSLEFQVINCPLFYKVRVGIFPSFVLITLI